MIFKTVQILWHEREPIFSCDFHSSGRLATCGGDNDVKIWWCQHATATATATPTPDADGDSNGDAVPFRFLASLSRHLKAVNVVRFSPNGQWLASGSDDANVLLWQRVESAGAQACQPPPPPPAAAVGGVAGAAADGGESWQLVHTLRGHLSDVYDIAWRADSGALCSGSTDNAVFVWDMARTSSGSKAATTKIEAHRLEGHTHFVQGVAWDPRGVFLCSAASDRTVRVYRRRTGGSDWHCSHVIAKLDAPRSMAIGLGKAVRLFADETININSFFRRLSWTPDGSLLLVPAGIAAVPAAAAAVASSAPPPHQHQQQQQQQQLHCVYVFARNALHRPLMRLAAAPKPFVCVRANPLCFEPRPGADRAGRWLQLAYRMVIAAATTDSVLLYETDSGGAPIALVKHAHYAELTDLAWSADGRQLVVSSKDGYCSLLTFDADELGRPSPLVL
eukprot:TRINITY_DN144_c0_g1_i2.p1 TRINITY_DN144_c0_g1~~TRINITY_DN144_c0_g1_i2.p1  ORF type:complete len:449 (-),score=166.97 TRINITY_DN144_c0_g1_i2:75-1421(-)